MGLIEGDNDIFNVFGICYFFPLIFRKGEGNTVPRDGVVDWNFNIFYFTILFFYEYGV